MDNEDTAILNYFKDRKNGFYVDVGCYHPIHRNNTHYYICRIGVELI